MAAWRRTLQRMLNDTNPVGYRYDEAAAVLRGLGFDLAPSSGGSHRKWWHRTPGGTTARIGLVESGRGTLKPFLVRQMVATLREHNLVPAELE